MGRIAWRRGWRAGASTAAIASGCGLPKSLEAVTAIHGILRTGASYVPVDPTGPACVRRGNPRGQRRQGGVVAAELVPALTRGLARRRSVASTDRGRRQSGSSAGIAAEESR